MSYDIKKTLPRPRPPVRRDAGAKLADEGGVGAVASYPSAKAAAYADACTSHAAAQLPAAAGADQAGQAGA